MTPVLNEENFCRLAKPIIERHNCSYAEALGILAKLQLNLVCDESIKYSAASQAALLTAVNCGKRAFHGGVSVLMPPQVACLVPWPEKLNLNEIVFKLGAQLKEPLHSEFSHTLYFGTFQNTVVDGLAIHCTGWRGGVSPADMPISLRGESDFALGGILAGALGVAKGFLRVSGLSSRFVDTPQGVSLWSSEPTSAKSPMSGRSERKRVSECLEESPHRLARSFRARKSWDVSRRRVWLAGGG